jgi:hypothetical protein
LIENIKRRPADFFSGTSFYKKSLQKQALKTGQLIELDKLNQISHRYGIF